MIIDPLDILQLQFKVFGLEMDKTTAKNTASAAANQVRVANMDSHKNASSQLEYFDTSKFSDATGSPIQLDLESYDYSFGRLDNYQSKYGCFLSIFEAPEDIGSGRLPVALKDVFSFDNHIPTAGLSNPPAGINLQHSTAIMRLQNAGGHVVATTKLSQWCYLPVEWNEFVTPPKNPLGANRLVGGSSSGAAVAVASGAVPVALGTDTGGSVRIPAALCGVYGFKPSTSRIPMDGIVPLGPTQDTVGIMARSLGILTQVFQVMANGVQTGEDNSISLNVGIPDGILDNCDSQTIAALRLATNSIISQKGSVRGRPALPLEQLNAVAGIITGYEAAQYHGPRMAQFPQEYSSSVVDRLLVGMAFSSDVYNTAHTCRYYLIARVMSEIFADCEFLMLPVVARHRFPVSNPNNTDRAQLSHLSLNVLSLNRWINLTGLPSISIPIKVSKNEIAAVQLVGRFGEDEKLLRATEIISSSLNVT